jgi:hypothetical protein
MPRRRFDPAFALLHWSVLEVSFHGVGNLGGVVFPQSIHISNSAGFQPIGDGARKKDA